MRAMLSTVKLEVYLRSEVSACIGCDEGCYDRISYLMLADIFWTLREDIERPLRSQLTDREVTLENA